MKVLIFTTDYRPQLGGIATYSHNIAKSLSRLCEVTVLTVKLRGWNTFDVKQNFSTVRVINWPIIRELIFTIHIIWLIRNNRIDRILNVTWFPCGMLSFFVTRFFKIPYFITAHGSEFLDDKTTLKRRVKGWLSWLKLLTMKKAKRIFAVSHYTQSKLLSLGISSSQITVIPNGVDINKFFPYRNVNAVKARFGLKDKKVLLTVARLDPHKGHDMVIKSLPRVIKKVPNLIYIIVGQGPEEKRLKNMVHKLCSDDKVWFLGYVPEEDLVNLYNASDLFIMLSRVVPGMENWIEGFGISFLEANACGKPTIGGHSGGVSDAIIDGQTGILVNPTDIDEISKAVCKLLTDETYALKLGRQGIRRTEDELNWDKISESLKSLMGDSHR